MRVCVVKSVCLCLNVQLNEKKGKDAGMQNECFLARVGQQQQQQQQIYETMSELSNNNNDNNNNWTLFSATQSLELETFCF